MNTASNAAENAARQPLSSEQWWAQTRRDPSAFRRWLRDQLRGERTAAGRILLLRDQYARQPRTPAHRLLALIARQEATHARWVEALLVARGWDASVDPAAQERYWPEVLSGIDSLEVGAAVAAHAEQMRLERIEVIARDESAPADVRAVFSRILRQERFHARAFAVLAGERALERTRGAHELGRRALGLVA